MIENNSKVMKCTRGIDGRRMTVALNDELLKKVLTILESITRLTVLSTWFLKALKNDGFRMEEKKY